MKTMSSSSSFSVPHESSNYDEVYLHQTLLFSDSLKDLKNLRTQLYSAAKYFEDSYAEDTQKEIVVNTLKDYAIKAIVNTVDHLGSITFKVNGLVDDQVDEVSTAEFRVSCIEQRLRTCQQYIDREGFTQQSLVMTTPKYHKRYILPDGETKPCAGQTISKYEGSSLEDDRNWKQMKSAIRATMKAPPQPAIRKGPSPSPAPRPSLPPRNFSFADKQRVSEKRTTSPTPRSLRPGVSFSFTDKQRETERRATSPTPRPLRPGVHFSFTDKQRESERRNASPTPQPSLRPGHLSFIDKPQFSEKRTTSPKHSKFPLLRSGSLLVRSPSVRSTTPLPDRTTAPISSDKKRYPSEPRKSYSMRLPADIDKPKDIEQQPSKSKSILKALLSRRKSKKDETTLYNFLDEY